MCLGHTVRDGRPGNVVLDDDVLNAAERAPAFIDNKGAIRSIPGVELVAGHHEPVAGHAFGGGLEDDRRGAEEEVALIEIRAGVTPPDRKRQSASSKHGHEKKNDGKEGAKKHSKWIRGTENRI